MFDYCCKLAFDYFVVITNVWASDDDEAEKSAIQMLTKVAGLDLDSLGSYELTLDIEGRMV
jgi:acyl carrier protein